MDSDTWFRLSDLLAQLKSIEQRVACRHLLILDANRQSANWSIGRLDDGVSERIAEAVHRAAAPNLVVLNSASPGQLGCTSLQLCGSVFGYWLRRGLAGEADTDENGRVWLRELVAYLQEQVDGLAQAHRAARQVPLLCPGDARDFPLAWTLNPRRLRRLSQPDDRPATASALPSGEKRARLWQQHDELAALLPGHFAPLRWQQLEHELLWLDQAAVAGRGYRAVADQLGERLEGELHSLLEQVRGRSGPEALSPFGSLLRWPPILRSSMRNLPPRHRLLAEYLGLPASATGGAGEFPLSRLLTRDTRRRAVA